MIIVDFILGRVSRLLDIHTQNSFNILSQILNEFYWSSNFRI